MLILLIRWILFALALLGIAYTVPGISVAGFSTALIVTIVIGIVNLLIKPLVLILTLPINILTLGLFTLVINALLFLLVAHMVPGFTVDGFLNALIGSILFSILSIAINSITEF